MDDYSSFSIERMLSDVAYDTNPNVHLDIPSCDTCMQTKITTISATVNLFNVYPYIAVHMDVCGPIKPSTI